MPCPNCKQDVVPTAIGFTWWGGMIGAKMLNHVECPSCHTRYNGKTGQSNSTGIAIYIIITSMIAIGLVYAITHH